MSDEITKPVEEDIVTESPVTEEELTVVAPEVSPDLIPTSPVLDPAPISEPVLPPNTSQQIPTPIGTEPKGEVVVVPVAVPVTVAEVLTPSTKQQEPTSRPYSLDPKLNKMIEAFVRGMNNSKENLILAQKAVKAKMMKRVYKVMDLFKKKKKIKNDDVEKFIHVSDDTATKYLNILTKEGKVKREGNPHAPYYTKVDPHTHL